MAKPRPAAPLSYSRLTDCIASLEADVRSAKDLSAFDRKRALTFLAGLTKIVRAQCMDPSKQSDFIVGSSTR